jgi:hypothetical protein
VGSVGFFSAYYTTRRRPVALKMILILIIFNAFGSTARIFSPYMVKDQWSCGVVFQLNSFIFTFSLIWSSCMAVLTAKSMKIGFQALTNAFFKVCLTLSLLLALFLSTMPLWLSDWLRVDYNVNEAACSLIVDTEDGDFGSVVYFFYSLLAGFTLILTTLISSIITFYKLRQLRYAVFPTNFHKNMARLIWYPILEVIICLPTMISCILVAYYDVESAFLAVLQQVFLGLAGFVATSIYVTHRLLIRIEDKKMEISDMLSLSLSEKVNENLGTSDPEMFTFGKNDMDY